MMVNGESKSEEERLKIGDWEEERLFFFYEELQLLGVEIGEGKISLMGKRLRPGKKREKKTKERGSNDVGFGRAPLFYVFTVNSFVLLFFCNVSSSMVSF